MNDTKKDENTAVAPCENTEPNVDTKSEPNESAADAKAEKKANHKTTKNAKNGEKSEVREFVKDIGIALILVLITLQFVQTTEVVGCSMEPNFYEKDYLFLDKTAYQRHDPEIGDVVVFKSTLKDKNNKDELLIKRVCALPGDHVRIADGKVYVNDQEQDQSFTKDGTTNGEIDTTVPEGTVFCMGDNRLNSIDSRFTQVGFIKVDTIKGKVIFRLLPFKSFGKISAIGDTLKVK